MPLLWQYQVKAEPLRPPAGPEQWQPAQTQPDRRPRRVPALALTALIYLPPPVTVEQWAPPLTQPDRTPRSGAQGAQQVGVVQPPPVVTVEQWAQPFLQPDRTPRAVSPGPGVLVFTPAPGPEQWAFTPPGVFPRPGRGVQGQVTEPVLVAPPAPLVFIRIRTRRGPEATSRRGETVRSRRGVGVTTRREET